MTQFPQGLGFNLAYTLTSYGKILTNLL
jgi:hypothetical protein